MNTRRDEEIQPFPEDSVLHDASCRDEASVIRERLVGPQPRNTRAAHDGQGIDRVRQHHRLVGLSKGHRTIKNRRVETLDRYRGRAAGCLVLWRQRDVEHPGEMFVQPEDFVSLGVHPYASTRAPGQVNAEALFAPVNGNGTFFSRSVVNHHSGPTMNASVPRDSEDVVPLLNGQEHAERLRRNRPGIHATGLVLGAGSAPVHLQQLTRHRRFGLIARTRFPCHSKLIRELSGRRSIGSQVKTE